MTCESHKNNKIVCSRGVARCHPDQRALANHRAHVLRTRREEEGEEEGGVAGWTPTASQPSRLGERVAGGHVAMTSGGCPGSDASPREQGARGELATWLLGGACVTHVARCPSSRQVAAIRLGLLSACIPLPVRSRATHPQSRRMV